MRNLILLFTLLSLIALLIYQEFVYSAPEKNSQVEYSYWLKLYRKSNVEFLYSGEPGKVMLDTTLKIYKM